MELLITVGEVSRQKEEKITDTGVRLFLSNLVIRVGISRRPMSSVT